MPPYRTTRRRNRRGPYAVGSRKAAERRLPAKYVRPVASIAKRVISHLTERKHLNINRDDIDVFGLTYYYTDPMQFIVAGTGDGNRIGSKLSDVWLHLAFSWNHSATTWNGSVLRVLVVKCDQQLPNAASAWNSTSAATGVFQQLLTNNFQISSAFPIGHDYTVVADKLVSSQRQYNTPTYGLPGVRRFRVKLGNMVYNNEPVSGVTYQKFKNVYILVGLCNAGVSLLDNMGRMQFSGMVTWRDA